MLTLEQLRVLPGLNALRILAWAGRSDGLAVGDLAKRITSGRERKALLDPLLAHGLIRKLGKRPNGRYTTHVRLPRLRDGETAEYLDDPDTTWAYLDVMLGVALGASVENPSALAQAIGLDRGTVRPYMAEARAFHRMLYELTGIEAAVAYGDDSEAIPTRSAAAGVREATRPPPPSDRDFAADLEPWLPRSNENADRRRAHQTPASIAKDRPHQGPHHSHEARRRPRQGCPHDLGLDDAMDEPSLEHLGRLLDIEHRRLAFAESQQEIDAAERTGEYRSTTRQCETIRQGCEQLYLHEAWSLWRLIVEHAWEFDYEGEDPTPDPD